jgi:hypothetical protein
MTTAECLEGISMITANYGDASLLQDVLEATCAGRDVIYAPDRLAHLRPDLFARTGDGTFRVKGNVLSRG